jgi:hypothetical protein
MRRAAAVLAILLTAALVTGCAGATSGDSSGKFQGQQRLVANTVEDLQSAGSKGDQNEVCGQLLARDLVQRLSRGGSCERTVDAALKDVDTFDLTVESVAVRGTTATARVKTENGDKDKVVTLGFVREARRWKISNLG